MGNFCCMICLILGMYSLFKEKKIFYPGFVFCILFFVSTFLSLLNIENVVVKDSKTYLIILLGVFSFFIGERIYNINIKKKFIRIEKKKTYFNSILYWMLLCIFLISSIIWLKDPMKIILSGGSIKDIYNQRLATEFSGSTGLMFYSDIKQKIILYICKPFNTALIPISVSLFFLKRKKIYIFIAILLMMINTLASGGRTTAIVLLIYVLVNYLILNNKIVTKKIKEQVKSSKSIKTLLFVLTIFIILIFINRGSNILYTIVSYYGYPIAYLEYMLKNNFTEYTYGMSSLQGLLRPIISVLGLEDPNTLILATNYLTQIQKTAYLAKNITYNAFVTLFFFFYSDFGYIGVILLSMILGYFSDSMYKKAIITKDAGYIAMFLLSFAIPICFAIVRFQFVMQDIVYGLVIIRFVFYSKKIVFGKEFNNESKHDSTSL